MPLSPLKLSSLPAILTALIVTSSSPGGTSFQISLPWTTSRPTKALTSSIIGDHYHQLHRPLCAVMDKPPMGPMRPMEEEREKNSNDNNDDDRRELKQVAGGFLTNFLRRFSLGVDDAVANSSSLDTTTTNTGRQPAIVTVDTLEDYKRIVVDERSSIVVVRFHAPWCKSCKAAYPLFQKMASEYQNHSHSSSLLSTPPNVKFVEVPLTKETAYLHEGLGVPSVPFGHIYHPDAGLVEERKLNRKVFGEFRVALEGYVRGSCDLMDESEEDGDQGVWQEVDLVGKGEFQ